MRAERCNSENYTIGLAYRTFLSNGTAKSVFWTLKTNPLLLEVRKARLTSSSLIRPRSKDFIFIKNTKRLLNLLNAKAQSPLPACLRVDPELKPIQLYSISSIPHTKKQLLLRWMGMKAICLPTDCPVCGERGSQAHWTDCFQLSEVALNIYEAEYAKAYDAIARVVSLYHSLKLPTTGTPLVGK